MVAKVNFIAFYDAWKLSRQNLVYDTNEKDSLRSYKTAVYFQGYHIRSSLSILHRDSGK